MDTGHVVYSHSIICLGKRELSIDIYTTIRKNLKIILPSGKKGKNGHTAQSHICKTQLHANESVVTGIRPALPQGHKG